MHGTYWTFDKLLFRPIEMKYLSRNNDGSVRFTYVGASSHKTEFQAFPLSAKENQQISTSLSFFENRTDCLRNAIQQLLQQF